MRFSGLYASFLKGQGHKGNILLGKEHPMMKLQICTGAFQGHQGNDQVGHGGNRLRCLREVSGLIMVLNDLLIIENPEDWVEKFSI